MMFNSSGVTDFIVGDNRYPYFDTDAASRFGSMVGYNCHYISNGKSPTGSPRGTGKFSTQVIQASLDYEHYL